MLEEQRGEKTTDKEKSLALKAPGVDARCFHDFALHVSIEVPDQDVRTVEVLNHMGYIQWTTRSMQNYCSFRKIMLGLSKDQDSLYAPSIRRCSLPQEKLQTLRKEYFWPFTISKCARSQKATMAQWPSPKRSIIEPRISCFFEQSRRPSDANPM